MVTRGGAAGRRRLRSGRTLVCSGSRRGCGPPHSGAARGYKRLTGSLCCPVAPPAGRGTEEAARPGAGNRAPRTALPPRSAPQVRRSPGAVETEAEAEALRRPWSPSRSWWSGPCPLRRDGLGVGALQLPAAAAVSSLGARPLAPRPPAGPEAPPRPVRAPLLPSSPGSAPGRPGCGSLCPRPEDQNFLECFFPGRHHPVDLPRAPLVPGPPGGAAGGGLRPPGPRLARMWPRRAGFPAGAAPPLLSGRFTLRRVSGAGHPLRLHPGVPRRPGRPGQRPCPGGRLPRFWGRKWLSGRPVVGAAGLPPPASYRGFPKGA